MSNDNTHTGRARIIAKVDSAYRPDGMAIGSAKFTVSYIALDGSVPSGKAVLTVGNIDSTAGLSEDLRGALAQDINAKYAGANIRARDIVGYSL
jgi:hypothetical protein